LLIVCAGILVSGGLTLWEIAQEIPIPFPFYHQRIWLNLTRNNIAGIVPFPFWPLNFPFHSKVVRFAYNPYPSHIMTILYLVWAQGILFLALTIPGWNQIRQLNSTLFGFLIRFAGVYLGFFMFLEQLIPHQYSYLAQILPVAVLPAAVSIDSILRRELRNKSILIAVFSALVIVASLSLFKVVSVPVDSRQTPMARFMLWNPRAMIFEFPFDFRAAFPPVPRIYPNHRFFRYLPEAFRDGERAGIQVASNRTYFLQPMFVRQDHPLSRTFELEPTGPDGVRDALLHAQTETLTVLMGVAQEEGAPINISVELDQDPELLADDESSAGLAIDLRRTGDFSPQGNSPLQYYAFDLCRAAYVDRKKITVTVDGEPDTTFRFVGHEVGGWLTNLPESSFPSVELGIEIVGSPAPLDGMNLFVIDPDHPVGPSIYRVADIWTMELLAVGEYRFTWPAMALNEWAMFSTIHRQTNPVTTRILYAGPLSGLQETPDGWRAVHLEATPAVKAFGSHAYVYIDSYLPLPVLPVGLGLHGAGD